MTTARTLLWRERCRLAFDALWRGDDPPFDRKGAYAWLGRTLGTSTPRLSDLTAEQCVRVMRAVRGLLHARHSVGLQIDQALASAGFDA